MSNFCYRSRYSVSLLGRITCFALAALALSDFSAHADKRGKPAPKKPTAPRASATAFRPDDVMATVEGAPITRRELTYFWLQIDTQRAAVLGDLLADRWKAVRGRAASYTLTDADIYAKLYGNNSTAYAPTLSSLVTNRLVRIEAARKGIVVTQTQALANAHELFDQVREQRNLKLSDEELIKMYRLPRDIFLEDMAFRVQTERLMAADFARRNGHPLGPNDWIISRSLFAEVEPAADAAETERRFAEAKKHIEDWVVEVKGGKSFEEAARGHNTDFTRDTGGLRGPTLRGTGTPAVEAVIYALKPGEMSAPLRTKNGWYVFVVEKRGSQIPAEERTRAWKNMIEAQRPFFLNTLRKNAKITSKVPLPVDTPSAINTQPSASAQQENPQSPPPPPVDRN